MPDCIGVVSVTHTVLEPDHIRTVDVVSLTVVQKVYD